MGGRLRTGILSRYVTSQLGQLGLASLRGRLVELRLGEGREWSRSIWHVSECPARLAANCPRLYCVYRFQDQQFAKSFAESVSYRLLIFVRCQTGIYLQVDNCCICRPSQVDGISKHSAFNCPDSPDTNSTFYNPRKWLRSYCYWLQLFVVLENW